MWHMLSNDLGHQYTVELGSAALVRWSTPRRSWFFYLQNTFFEFDPITRDIVWDRKFDRGSAAMILEIAGDTLITSRQPDRKNPAELVSIDWTSGVVKTLLTANGRFESAAVSPDGETLVAIDSIERKQGSRKTWLRQLDLKSGLEDKKGKRAIKGWLAPVHFSAPNECVYLDGRDIVGLRLTDHVEIFRHTFSGSPTYVIPVRYNKSLLNWAGTEGLVVGGDDGTVCLINAQTGNTESTLGTQNSRITGLAMSGRGLITSSRDSIELIDAKSQRLLARRMCQWEVVSLAASENGMQIATGGRPSVALWDVEDDILRHGNLHGRVESLIERIATSHDGSLLLLKEALSRDSRLVVVGRNASGEYRRTRIDDPWLAMNREGYLVDPNGKYFHEPELRGSTFSAKKPTESLYEEDRGTEIGFDGQHRLVVLAESSSITRVEPATKNEATFELQEGWPCVTGTICDAGKRCVVTRVAGNNTMLEMYDTETWKRLGTLLIPTEPTFLRNLPGGDGVYFLTEKGTSQRLHIWTGQSGESESVDWQAPDYGELVAVGHPSGVIVLQGERHPVTMMIERIEVRDFASGVQVGWVPETSKISCFAVSGNGKHLFIGTVDQRLRQLPLHDEWAWGVSQLELANQLLNEITDSPETPSAIRAIWAQVAACREAVRAFRNRGTASSEFAKANLLLSSSLFAIAEFGSVSKREQGELLTEAIQTIQLAIDYFGAKEPGLPSIKFGYLSRKAAMKNGRLASRLAKDALAELRLAIKWSEAPEDHEFRSRFATYTLEVSEREGGLKTTLEEALKLLDEVPGKESEKTQLLINWRLAELDGSLNELDAMAPRLLAFSKTDAEIRNKLLLYYHETKFDFEAAFKINESWMNRSDSTTSKIGFAESCFTTGRFELGTHALSSLDNVADLSPTYQFAVRYLKALHDLVIASPEEAQQDIAQLASELKKKADDFRVGWMWGGVKKSIATSVDPRVRSKRQVLLDLVRCAEASTKQEMLDRLGALRGSVLERVTNEAGVKGP